MPSPVLIERELRCPRDGTPMEKLAERDVTFDRCVACHGTWFDASELRRVCGDPLLESVATRSVPIAQPSLLACPRCWGDCEETRVGRVRLDTCTSCRGVWFDARELAAAREELDALRASAAALSPWQLALLALAGRRAPPEAPDER